MSRWRVLNRTSPSGKRLFGCNSCGRVSPTPDKHCSRPNCESFDAHYEAEATRRLNELIDKFRKLGGVS